MTTGEPRIRRSDPFFLFLGPDKAGSTWLATQLDLHPGLHVSPAKDVYYFDRNYNRGWDWYADQFRGGQGEQVLCDISHDYLFSPEAAERIREDLGHVRMLCVVRSPLERSFSQFLNFHRAGQVPLDFDAAVRKFPRIISNSHYATHLPPYVELFGPDELRVMRFDELTDDPAGFLRSVFDFVGVDSAQFDFTTAASKVYEAGKARSRLASAAAKRGAIAMRAIGLPRVVGKVKSSRVASMLYTDYADRPEITADLKARYGSLFRADVDYLERELGFDLSGWRRDLEAQ